MTHETFRKAIAEALDPEYAAMIPEHGEHIFSEKFERRMQKLISRRSKPYYSFISTGLRRAACIVVMFLVVSFTTVMSVEALRKPFLDFLSSIFSDHTTIESVLDLDGDYPETIEERYGITEWLEDYYLDSEEINRTSSHSYYKSKYSDAVIVIAQYTAENCKLYLNTENKTITYINIGSTNAILFNNKGYNTLIWNNGRYIIELSSSISENALIELAETVKKIE